MAGRISSFTSLPSNPTGSEASLRARTWSFLSPRETTGAPRPSTSPVRMDLLSRVVAEAAAGGMATVGAEGQYLVAGVMEEVTGSPEVVAEGEEGEEVMAGEALAVPATSAVRLDTLLKIVTRAEVEVATEVAVVLAITVVRWGILLEIATRVEAEGGGMVGAAVAVDPAITVAKPGTLLGSARAGTDNEFNLPLASTCFAHLSMI